MKILLVLFPYQRETDGIVGPAILLTNINRMNPLYNHSYQVEPRSDNPPTTLLPSALFQNHCRTHFFFGIIPIIFHKSFLFLSQTSYPLFVFRIMIIYFVFCWLKHFCESNLFLNPFVLIFYNLSD